MSSLRPGGNGDPIPAGSLIFRIGKNIHYSQAALDRRKALPEMFELSSEEKRTEAKRLSVWAEELTVADQAWAFMGARPVNTVVACLSADKVRAIVPPDGFAALDVQWEQATRANHEGTEVPNTDPGAEGHCGVANLYQGGERSKADGHKRKGLRSAIADIAEISPVPVPHEIPEEHLRVAAYYLSLQGQACAEHPEALWVLAVRQLRREIVKRHRQQQSSQA